MAVNASSKSQLKTIKYIKASVRIQSLIFMITMKLDSSNYRLLIHSPSPIIISFNKVITLLEINGVGLAA